MTPNLTAPLLTPAAAAAKLLALFWESASDKAVAAATAELGAALALAGWRAS